MSDEIRPRIDTGLGRLGQRLARRLTRQGKVRDASFTPSDFDVGAACSSTVTCGPAPGGAQRSTVTSRYPIDRCSLRR